MNIIKPLTTALNAAIPGPPTARACPLRCPPPRAAARPPPRRAASRCRWPTRRSTTCPTPWRRSRRPPPRRSRSGARAALSRTGRTSLPDLRSGIQHQYTHYYLGGTVYGVPLRKYCVCVNKLLNVDVASIDSDFQTKSTPLDSCR